MKELKKLTLLHSNDMHGDFLAEEVDEKLVGGVSRLSGYVNRVRSGEENVLYCVAGDMFRGSVIDSEYRGFSTVEIMNALAPDIVTVGNHEVDYGIAHLLLLDKCANFPIVNANLRIRGNGARLFPPAKLLKVGGMRVLFIGVVTDEVLSVAEKEGLKEWLDVTDPVQEIGRICCSYRRTDVDLTVLLTHIGFEADKQLAAQLDPSWGVDIIVGGHSHTFVDEPELVNDVLIVQAGIGTDRIGRFDLLIDTEENRVHSWKWAYVDIDESCPRDEAVETCLERFKSGTDAKYNRVLTRMHRRLSHPARNRETELGNLFADLLTEALQVDCALFASGGIRKDGMGPLVQYGDLTEAVPFDEPVYEFRVTGAQFKAMIRYMLREEAFAEGAHTEFYQLPSCFRISYDRSKGDFTRFEFRGEELAEDRILTVAALQYHFLNLDRLLRLPKAEMEKNGRARMVSTSTLQLLEESFGDCKGRDSRIEGRLQVLC